MADQAFFDKPSYVGFMGSTSLEPRENLHASVLLLHAIQKLAQKLDPF
jgi:hypothetical protein